MISCLLPILAPTAYKQSLERMTLALARDRLSYTVAQLESLSQQVREGDLTPVLRIYEDDIRAPLKSIVSGTLMRSIFIQVQKAKVKIVALSQRIVLTLLNLGRHRPSSDGNRSSYKVTRTDIRFRRRCTGFCHSLLCG